MQTFAISSIQVKNRIRREFDEAELERLAESIYSKGLMHPPVIRPDGLDARLVAGERRLRAISLLFEKGCSFKCNNETFNSPIVPCTRIEDLSENDLLEAELEENVLRSDLTWQEQAAAEKSLHDLRLRQRGPYHKGQNPEGQTVQATASELEGKPASGSRTADIRNNLTLAEHLGDPEIAQAKTPKDALTILKARAEADLIGILAERMGQRQRNNDFTLVHGPFTFLQTNETFDCICTDPPYGVDAQAFGSQTASDRAHSYKDTYKHWVEIMEEFPYKAWSAAKRRAHLYCLVSFQNYMELRSRMLAAGWVVWHRPLIWDKGSQGLVPDPKCGPRYTHDYVLFANKGAKTTNGVYDDVIRVPQATKLLRAAEKPVGLYINLLSRSCVPGDHAWDPFCGSGSVFPAARKLSLRATGHDIDKAAIDLARTRLVD